jgi:hypothetical protein
MGQASVLVRGGGSENAAHAAAGVPLLLVLVLEGLGKNPGAAKAEARHTTEAGVLLVGAKLGSEPLIPTAPLPLFKFPSTALICPVTIGLEWKVVSLRKKSMRAALEDTVLSGTTPLPVPTFPPPPVFARPAPIWLRSLSEKVRRLREAKLSSEARRPPGDPPTEKAEKEARGVRGGLGDDGNDGLGVTSLDDRWPVAARLSTSLMVE